MCCRFQKDELLLRVSPRVASPFSSAFPCVTTARSTSGQRGQEFGAIFPMALKRLSFLHPARRELSARVRRRLFVNGGSIN